MAASTGRGGAGAASCGDYYALLGVRVDATFREIGRAYWRLASERRDQLPILNEAYEVLSNAVRRSAYDAGRQQGAEQPEATAAEAARSPSPGLRQKLNWYLR